MERLNSVKWKTKKIKNAAKSNRGHKWWLIYLSIYLFLFFPCNKAPFSFIFNLKTMTLIKDSNFKCIDGSFLGPILSEFVVSIEVEGWLNNGCKCDQIQTKYFVHECRFSVEEENVVVVKYLICNLNSPLNDGYCYRYSIIPIFKIEKNFKCKYTIWIRRPQLSK